MPRKLSIVLVYNNRIFPTTCLINSPCVLFPLSSFNFQPSTLTHPSVLDFSIFIRTPSLSLSFLFPLIQNPSFSNSPTLPILMAYSSSQLTPTLLYLLFLSFSFSPNSVHFNSLHHLILRYLAPSHIPIHSCNNF